MLLNIGNADLATNIMSEHDCSEYSDPDNAELSFLGELLPDLVLEHIFSFLPITDKVNVEYVCKRWFFASRRSWIHVKSFDVQQVFHLRETITFFTIDCDKFMG